MSNIVLGINIVSIIAHNTVSVKSHRIWHEGYQIVVELSPEFSVCLHMCIEISEFFQWDSKVIQSRWCVSIVRGRAECNWL
jgi:hypothetical protein